MTGRVHGARWESILTGLRWRLVQDILLCRGDWQDSFVEQCEELGLAMAAGPGCRYLLKGLRCGQYRARQHASR